MKSLSSWCDRHEIPKSTVHALLKERREATGDEAYATANGLTPTAEAFLMDHYQLIESPTVTVVDEPEHGTVKVEGFGGGEMVFNPAQMLGMTNGTAGAIAAMNQIQTVALQLQGHVEAMAEKGRQDYLQISSTARSTQEMLADLQRTITEARAASTVLETMKNDRLNEALDAQAKIQKLRGGPTAEGQK